jgi:hypothetical protein
VEGLEKVKEKIDLEITRSGMEVDRRMVDEEFKK